MAKAGKSKGNVHKKPYVKMWMLSLLCAVAITQILKEDPSGFQGQASNTCGNNFREAWEQCDDGNTNNWDGCNNFCKLSSCGDGIPNPSEQCDDGNTNNNDSCTNNCRHPVCGDKIITTSAWEECDDGNAINNDACTNQCHNAACLDNIVQPWEECDDGNFVNPSPGNGDTCNTSCMSDFCGNGVVDAGEQCDMPNDWQTGYSNCTAYCKAPVCGDKWPGPGEDCDDGNLINTDACPNNCKKPVCGDGVIQSVGANGIANDWDDEQCDAGKICRTPGQIYPDKYCQTNADCVSISASAYCAVDSWTKNCTDACKLPAAYCGDGTKQPSGRDGTFGTPDDEQCDDGGSKCAGTNTACTNDSDCGTPPQYFSCISNYNSSTCTSNCKNRSSASSVASTQSSTAPAASSSSSKSSSMNSASSSSSNAPADIDVLTAVSSPLNKKSPTKGTVTIEAAVKNNGPGIAQGVKATVTVAPGLTIEGMTGCTGSASNGVCELGTLTSGQNKPVTITIKVGDQASLCSSSNLQVSVHGTTTSTDTVAGNNISSQIIDVICPDLKVEKVILTPSNWQSAPDGVVTYEVRISNIGEYKAEGIVLTESPQAALKITNITGISGCPSFSAAGLAGPVNCSISSALEPGATALKATVTAKVSATATCNSAPQNTASVTTTGTEAVTNNNSDEETVGIFCEKPDLHISKILGGSKNKAPNSTAYFEVIVKNNGNAKAENVVMTESPEFGFGSIVSISGCNGGTTTSSTCNLGTMNAGASKTIVVAIKVPSRPYCKPSLTNTVSVSTTTQQSNSDNLSASDSITMNCGSSSSSVANEYCCNPSGYTCEVKPRSQNSCPYPGWSSGFYENLENCQSECKRASSSSVRSSVSSSLSASSTSSASSAKQYCCVAEAQAMDNGTFTVYSCEETLLTREQCESTLVITGATGSKTTKGKWYGTDKVNCDSAAFSTKCGFGSSSSASRSSSSTSSTSISSSSSSSSSAPQWNAVGIIVTEDPEVMDANNTPSLPDGVLDVIRGPNENIFFIPSPNGFLELFQFLFAPSDPDVYIIQPE